MDNLSIGESNWQKRKDRHRQSDKCIGIRQTQGTTTDCVYT